MIVFFALVVAVVALILARKAFNQIAGLRARLDALEAVALREVAATPSLTPRHELEQTLATSPPGTPAGQPEMAGEPTTAIGGTDSRASNETAAAPPPAAPALPGLEERVGTRWVVWLGGATLALGGFFLVRYSIDAGLLGPGVRVVLGGLFIYFALRLWRDATPFAAKRLYAYSILYLFALFTAMAVERGVVI